MTGLLLLLGLSISAFTIGGLFDDETSSSDSDPDPAIDPDNDQDTSDIVIDQTFQDLVTEAIGTDAAEQVIFLQGPLNVESGGGADFVAGGDGDDTLSLGDGDDIAAGGSGDDMISLGAGNDLYGNEGSDFFASSIGIQEFGDDTVLGGSGDDQIVDLFGMNALDGGAGNDFLQATDSPEEPEPSPDRVTGGTGDDLILVDRGDVVMTGTGEDEVRIVLGDGMGDIAGSDPVVIEDFDPADDLIQLGGVFDQDDLRIEVFENGTGSTIFWNETAVVRVVGGQTLTLSDIVIAG